MPQSYSPLRAYSVGSDGERWTVVPLGDTALRVFGLSTRGFALVVDVELAATGFQLAANSQHKAEELTLHAPGLLYELDQRGMPSDYRLTANEFLKWEGLVSQALERGCGITTAISTADNFLRAARDRRP